MFTKALIQNESVVLPTQGKNDRLQVVVDIESNGTILDMVCLGVGCQGYGIENYCVSCMDSEPTEIPLEWLPLSSRGRQDLRTLSMQLSELPEEVEQVWLILGRKDDEFLDSWGRGSVLIRSGIHSWEWMFHGSRLQRVSALKAIVFYRQKYTWSVKIEGQNITGSMDAFIERTMEQPQFHDIEPSSPSIKTVTHVDGMELPKQLDEVPAVLKNIYDLAQMQLKEYELLNYPTRYVLILDHTPAMRHLYETGQVQQFLQCMMGLSAHGNPEAEVMVFLAGQAITPLGGVRWDKYMEGAEQWPLSYPLEGHLQYGRIIETVRKEVYSANHGGETKQWCRYERPVFVLWVVTHDAQDAGIAQWQLRWASYEPIFWHFLAITEQRSPIRSSRSLMSYGGIGGEYASLGSFIKLNDCEMRSVDYSTLGVSGECVSQDLYRVMLEGYATWVYEAGQRGMIKKASFK